uniref:Nuclear transcription factor Y subunit gamma n=1 Tax=Sus scrofa TaxID=9823 RepID=A0A8D0Z519_PIG
MIKRNWILEWQLDCLPWSDLIESSRFLHGFLLIFLAVDDQAEKDFRVQELPLARIKKIMKLDEDVKMISAEAPVLFAKAAQIFITELTLRAWIHTEDNKRRTLQRNDIAMAITKFDQFDFLIDIVPRDELKPPKRQEEVRQSVTPAEPVQYYFTLAQQPTAVQVQGQQQGQQTTSSTTTIQPGQIIIAQPQQGQTTPVTMQVGEGQQVQIVQAQPQGQAQQAQSGTGQAMQVMQQIITNTGEIQQIPVSRPALRSAGLNGREWRVRTRPHARSWRKRCSCYPRPQLAPLQTGCFPSHRHGQLLSGCPHSACAQRWL